MTCSIEIKPLSVNKAWQGKRYKTKQYKAFEAEMLAKMPAGSVEGKKLRISLEFGFRRKSSDIDNPIKPTLDLLQKKYQFNDNQIYELCVKKAVGEEYIKYQIDQIL